MLTRLFNSQKPTSFAIAPLFALTIWVVHGFLDVKAQQNEYWFVFLHLKEFLNSFIPDLYISFLLLIAGALLVNKLAEKHQLIGGTSNLPAIIYILINSAHPSLFSFHPSLILNILLIFILDKLFSIYREDRVYPSIFDIGLLTGFSAIIHPPYLLMLVFAYISTYIIRAFSWKEWAILGCGFILPYYALWVIVFCIDPNFNAFSVFKGMQFHLIALDSFNFNDLYILVAFTTVALLSTKTWVKEFKKRVVKGKKMISVFNWFFIFSFFSLFVELSFYFPSISILSMPFTLFFSNYFYNSNNIIIKELVFFSLFIVVFYTQIVLL